jgi:hypothetical protein
MVTPVTVPGAPQLTMPLPVPATVTVPGALGIAADAGEAVSTREVAMKVKAAIADESDRPVFNTPRRNMKAPLMLKDSQNWLKRRFERSDNERRLKTDPCPMYVLIP